VREFAQDSTVDGTDLGSWWGGHRCCIGGGQESAQWDVVERFAVLPEAWINKSKKPSLINGLKQLSLS
jgi:hypothetical protein